MALSMYLNILFVFIIFEYFLILGTRFGMLMARMGILNILSKYEVSLREHHEEPFVFKQNSFILAPLKGINVHLTKRKFK